MTQSIAYIIYGIPLDENPLHNEMLRIIEENEELEDGGMPRKLEDFHGVTMLESVYGEPSGYIGVCLATFSYGESVHLDNFNLKASPEQKKIALEKILLLPEKLRDLADVAGHYLVWKSW